MKAIPAMRLTLAVQQQQVRQLPPVLLKSSLPALWEDYMNSTQLLDRTKHVVGEGH